MIATRPAASHIWGAQPAVRVTPGTPALAGDAPPDHPDAQTCADPVASSQTYHMPERDLLRSGSAGLGILVDIPNMRNNLPDLLIAQLLAERWHHRTRLTTFDPAKNL